MNFSALKTMLAGRGFSYLSDSDLGQYINDAVTELDSVVLWPYLEKSVTGSPAPLIVSDLRQVDQVIDVDNSAMVLERSSWSELAASYGDTGVTGTPAFWYFAEPISGSPEIATFPTSSHTIGIQYWRTSPTLSGTDTPLAPAEWHTLIVDMAQASAYPDGGAPQGLLARIDRRTQLMINALLGDYGSPMTVLDGVDC